jgi:glycerate kinase
MSIMADLSSLTVLVAPDSFKGTMSAAAAADAIRGGWLSRRPKDDVRCFPQADGGEGTADTIAATVDGARWHQVFPVCGPDGADVQGRWLELPGGVAVIELAQMSGITLMDPLNPDRASTFGFGQVILNALSAGATELVLCLGGSASNDGGAGAIQALGGRLLDEHGEEIVAGAVGLDSLRAVDVTGVAAAPPRGVTILTDVTAPLLGPSGATAVFGPQKGIADDRISNFEDRLRRLAGALPAASPETPGAGAAGGTAFGLLAVWNASIVSGASHVAELTGLINALPHADVIVSGEGRYDDQSAAGKVVGTLQRLASDRAIPVAIVAGRIEAASSGPTADLAVLAGGVAAAMADPHHYAWLAGARLADEY